MKQKILITGANGQLGTSLREIAGGYPDFNFIFLGKEDLPVQDKEAVETMFRDTLPSFCINCAAYTAVDRAEADKEEVWKINAEAVSTLAAVCRDFQTKFIHISTDYVFDGDTQEPYREDAGTNPKNVYGASKLEGEKLAFEYNPESVVIRTSWLYAREGKNFVNTMLRLMAEKKFVNVVQDQVGSPTYAPDLAAAIMTIISSGMWAPGVYHFSNDGVISWHEFAAAIKDISGSAAEVKGINATEYLVAAARPAYSGLDKRKITETWGIVPRNWRAALEESLAKAP